MSRRKLEASDRFARATHEITFDNVNFAYVTR